MPDLKDSFIVEKKKVGRPKRVKEAPAPQASQNEDVERFMQETVSKIGRDYAHRIFAVNLSDGNILIVPADALNQSRIAIILDTNAINDMANIIDAIRIRKMK